jgi:hypothetical protein
LLAQAADFATTQMQLLFTPYLGDFMKSIFSLCFILCSLTAFSQAPDMSQMGPASRKPTDEKKTKAEVADFFKKATEAEKGGLDATVPMHDFPIYMATDDAKGLYDGHSYSKEEYIAMMKPMMEGMPKDMKTTHKPTVTVLSDALVSFVDDFTTTMGKTKMTGKNSGLLVKVNGEWKWKIMVEAGWGGMPGPEAAPASVAPAAKPAAAPAAPGKK